MRCLLTRIIINRMEESGKSLPKIASNHILNCPECRTYMKVGKTMSMTDPVSNISENLIHNLNKKIVLRLDHSAKKKEPKFSGNLFLRISITTSMLILIITAGIIIMNINKKTTVSTNKQPLFSVKIEKDLINLNKLLTRVESPIIEEADKLKSSLKLAETYLRSVIDFGLPEIQD